MNGSDGSPPVPRPPRWYPVGSDEPGRPPLVVMVPPTPPPPARRRWKLPLFLFIVTALSTLVVGGPLYAAGVMIILTTHELGHFLQARRYGITASFPYFIPMPISPLGTMGAIIAMRARVADVRALFDIAITGPLAGLVPSLIATVIGLARSTVTPLPEGNTLMLGEPLFFRFLSYLVIGPIDPEMDLLLHPLAFAGWVGIFLTALNLIPIGQLDGGHILYALLKRRAHPVAVGLLAAAVAAIAIGGYWGWSLLIVLLIIFGPRHPPTANDNVPLGPTRIVLGWLTLLFIIVGFTPTPMWFGPAP